MKRSHHNLLVWQKSMDLVQEIYRVTSRFPGEEIYSLTSQMRRAAVSVPSNIAEGAARSGNREFLKFLSIARGSLSELETQVRIAKNLGFIKDDIEILSEIDTIFSLLGGLIKSINKKENK